MAKLDDSIMSHVTLSEDGDGVTPDKPTDSKMQELLSGLQIRE